MKRTIRLSEAELHRVIKESVNAILNEVKYDGVSYHGTNPYDWVDIKDIRDEYGDRFIDDEIKAERNGDENLKNQANRAWKKNYRKVVRNKNNARELGWKGKGDTRLGKANEYFNLAQNANNPQEKERYNKMSIDTLGDIDGRAQKNLNKINASKQW